jgi:hypothetical protein
MIHQEMLGRMRREQLTEEAERARAVRAARSQNRPGLRGRSGRLGRQPGRPLILAAVRLRQWLASTAAGARTGLGTGASTWSVDKAARRTR